MNWANLCLRRSEKSLLTLVNVEHYKNQKKKRKEKENNSYLVFYFSFFFFFSFFLHVLLGQSSLLMLPLITRIAFMPLSDLCLIMACLLQMLTCWSVWLKAGALLSCLLFLLVHRNAPNLLNRLSLIYSTPFHFQACHISCKMLELSAHWWVQNIWNNLSWLNAPSRLERVPSGESGSSDIREKCHQ